MKKILITGGAGFIGSHLQDKFLKEGCDVFVYDDLSWGNKLNLNNDSYFVKGSILDVDKLYELFRKENFDTVIHCAASLEVSLSQTSPVTDLKINTEGTINVLEAMKLSGTNRLINFSSACVYGFGEIGMEQSIENRSKIEPQWGYGSSKASAEIYIQQYCKTYGFCATNIRPGITSGPREWFGRVLTIFLKRAIEDKPLIIFGDGIQERDFVHVKDIVDLVHTEYKTRDLSAGVKTYNGGTGIATSISDLARLISKKTGVDINYEALEEGQISKMVNGRLRLPFEMQSMRLSMNKANNELGFYNSKSLEDIIDDELNWLQKKNDLASWAHKFKV